MIATTFIVAALSALSATAHPLQKRANIKSQCNHDFSMTFDDGPYQWTSELSQTFVDKGQKTTFYVNGKNWGCIFDPANVEHLRKAYADGHQIASHTWSHARLTDYQNDNFARIDYEIERLDEALMKIIGVKPRYFRPPYGAINENIANHIEQKYGKTIVLWDIDSRDTQGINTAQGILEVFEGIAEAAQATGQCPLPPHLTLSHDVQAHSIVSAADSIDALLEVGYDLITTDQCLDGPGPYISTTTRSERDSTWNCDDGWVPSNPNPNPNPPTCQSTYTSKAGDSCTTIETAYGLPANAITTANSFVNCADIWAGTPICIPPGGTHPNGDGGPTTPPPPTCQSTYTSKAGDSCTTIETAYGLPANAIKTANSFVTCTDIWAGTPICIPPGGTHPNGDGGVTTPPPPTCQSTYTSKAGDSCTTIETAYGLPANAIKTANSFVTCTDIWAGTPICIPPGGTHPNGDGGVTTPPPPTCQSTYTSKAGDSCTTIEAAYGLPANAIKTANSFVTCTDIWVGTPICIPPGGTHPNGDGGVTTPPPPTPSTCVVTYVARAGDTCASIDAKFGMPSGSMQGVSQNSFINCADIWAGTNVCIPPAANNTPCEQTISASSTTTCTAVGNSYGVNADVIKYWNAFVNCADIWAGTQLCVSH